MPRFQRRAAAAAATLLVLLALRTIERRQQLPQPQPQPLEMPQPPRPRTIERPAVRSAPPVPPPVPPPVLHTVLQPVPPRPNSRMASSAEHARSGSRGGGGAAKTSLTLMVMLHGNNAEKVAAQQAHLVRYKGRWKSCGSTTVEFGGFHSFFNACRGCAAKGEQHTVLAQASATQRTAAMLMAMAREHPGVEWLFKLDDDGYLYVENLLAAACAQSEAMAAAPRPRYSGFLMRQVPDVWGVDYCAGGAGYLINRQALRSCEAVATCGSGKEDLPYEDVGLGYCLSTCGIKAERLEGAYPYTPEKAPTDMMIRCSQLHPDWEFFLWDEKTLQGLKYDSKYQNDGAYTLRKGFLMASDEDFSTWRPNLVGDVVRQEVLYRFGGVAFDADTVCLRSLNSLLDDLHDRGVEFAAAYESETLATGLVAAGTQFAVQYSEVVYHGLKALMAIPQMEPAWITTGPCHTTHIMYAGAMCWNASTRGHLKTPCNVGMIWDPLNDTKLTYGGFGGGTEEVCKPKSFHIFPSGTFYPYHHTDIGQPDTVVRRGQPDEYNHTHCSIAESTYMLQRWSSTFDSYIEAQHTNTAKQPKSLVRALHGSHFHAAVPTRQSGRACAFLIMRHR